MKSGYAFSQIVEDDLPKSVKTSSALDLSKIDDTHESNDLNFSPTANASAYDKSEMKWRSSPKSNFIVKFSFDLLFHCSIFFVDGI